MSRYPEIDLSKITPQPIAERPSKVTLDDLCGLPTAEDATILDRLPDLLTAENLRFVIKRTVEASRAGFPVIFGAGAHLVKTGVGPLLVGLAVNGAFVIHDLELAHFGKTSEDVQVQLPLGRFGMSRETAELVNGAFEKAAREGLGAGEALGLVAGEGKNREISVLARLYERSIPVTVHVALGTDITHMHPNCDGAAIGEAGLRDFRILCHLVAGLGGEGDALGGCYLNWGSAVLLPEVFLKAVSVARNLGMSGRFTTAAFDFNLAYRVNENVVKRPSPGDGRYLVGPHEVLLPLFYAGCRRELENHGA